MIQKFKAWAKAHPMFAILLALLIGALFLAAPVAMLVSWAKAKAKGAATTAPGGAATADKVATSTGAAGT